MSQCPQCESSMFDYEILYDDDLEYEYYFCLLCDWSIVINHTWVNQ